MNDPVTRVILDVVKYLQLHGNYSRVYPTDAWGFVSFECHPHTVRRRMHRLVELGQLERISYHGGYRLADPARVSRDELASINTRLWGGKSPLPAS